MKKYILIPLLCLSLTAPAQDVSFVNMGQLLGPIASFFSYNDCALDMNGDYLDDVVRVSFDGIYIDYQQPDGAFSQVHYDIPLQNEPDWSICGGDLDGNGYNDLLFGGGNAVSFIYANDDGTNYFEDFKPLFIFSQRSNMVDIDNDGDLDAFICHDTDEPQAYRNIGGGAMMFDPTLIQVFDGPGNYSSIWVDYDNDGDTDLYLSKCKAGSEPGDVDRTNLLYRNNGNGTYTEVGVLAGVADNSQSWSTVFEDFDNDGDFDAFVVNHDFKNRFYRNNGDGTFTDIIDSTGIAADDLGSWENSAGDFNNDGYMDIWTEMSKRLYLGNGDLTFVGINIPVTPGSMGDFNNDGFLDVVKNNNLWINKGNDNNWLKVTTEGVQSNPNGIGARVEIYGPWGRQIREVRSGQSFAPMSTLQVHFGLGQADTIDQVVVKWPSGTVTVIDTPSINSTLVIKEAACVLAPTQIEASGSTSICPGDSLLLSLPDGYAYEWMNGDTSQSITVFNEGEVFATLTDSIGCISLTNTLQVKFIEEVFPIVEIDGFHTFCEGGELTLSTQSAANPVWSTGETGQSIVVSETGEYSVAADAFCQEEPLLSDTVVITELIVAPPVVDGVNIIQGEMAQLIASGNDLAWYDVPTGGSPIAVGDTLITTTLDATTTFYVEAHETAIDIQSGGKLDFEGNGGSSNLAGFNYFNVWKPFVLNFVQVRIPSELQAGNTTVLLLTADGDTLASKTVELEVGDHTIQLDWDIPVGDSLSLRNPEKNLFRNNGGVNYPYPIGEVGEIFSSFPFGTSSYYHFYDWKITQGEIFCSSERVPVTVEVTDADEAFQRAGFAIFPNPANQALFVKMDTPAERITLLNAQGQVVFEKKPAGNGTEKLAIGHLAAGMYFVRIESQGEVYQTKFVIE